MAACLLGPTLDFDPSDILVNEFFIVDVGLVELEKAPEVELKLCFDALHSGLLVEAPVSMRDSGELLGIISG